MMVMVLNGNGDGDDDDDGDGDGDDSRDLWHRRRWLQQKRHFEEAFALFQTLSHLFQSAENVNCNGISLELNS